MLVLSIGIVALAAWLYLIFGRGFFWLERPLGEIPESLSRAVVAIVVPARNEAAVIEQTTTALVQQDYPGYYHIWLVDDDGSDQTVALARKAAQAAGRSERLTVLKAPPLPEGWTGKLWALETGIQNALDVFPDIEYFLLTDADIVHPPNSLSRLLTRAEAGSFNGRPYDLVSLMARLHCLSFAEKLMIPAFVFFFQMLYPFRRANNPENRVAAAAGGVMLVRRKTLENIGGLASIRGALIDDCTLAAAVKRQGRIRIGLSSDITSVRVYDGFENIWRMVARTAFTQLHYSKLLLAGTVLGLLVTYIAPPLLLFSRSPWACRLGALSWLLMTVAYSPTVRLYRLNPLWAVTLPVTALIYMGATVDSARRHWLKKGGEWKGRAQAHWRDGPI
jgi:hopene-associated glycosyltransferase HpnB